MLKGGSQKGKGTLDSRTSWLVGFIHDSAAFVASVPLRSPFAALLLLHQPLVPRNMTTRWRRH